MSEPANNFWRADLIIGAEQIVCSAISVSPLIIFYKISLDESELKWLKLEHHLVMCSNL